MHFVDGDGSVQRFGAFAAGHPIAVIPLVGEIGDDGGEAHTGASLHAGSLHRERIRVRLVDRVHPPLDAVLVLVPHTRPLCKAFPDAGRSAFQNASVWIPVIELTEYCHTLGPGCPYREPRTVFGGMGAQPFVTVEERAILPALLVLCA